LHYFECFVKLNLVNNFHSCGGAKQRFGIGDTTTVVPATPAVQRKRDGMIVRRG